MGVLSLGAIVGPADEGSCKRNPTARKEFRCQEVLEVLFGQV